MTLNDDAWRIAEKMAREVAVAAGIHSVGGATVIDCGIDVTGGLQAGLGLAPYACRPGDIALVPGDAAGWRGPLVQVHSDDPVRAAWRADTRAGKSPSASFSQWALARCAASMAKKNCSTTFPGVKNRPSP